MSSQLVHGEKKKVERGEKGGGYGSGYVINIWVSYTPYKSTISQYNNPSKPDKRLGGGK